MNPDILVDDWKPPTDWQKEQILNALKDRNIEGKKIRHFTIEYAEKKERGEQ